MSDVNKQDFCRRCKADVSLERAKARTEKQQIILCEPCAEHIEKMLAKWAPKIQSFRL